MTQYESISGRQDDLSSLSSSFFHPIIGNEVFKMILRYYIQNYTDIGG